MFYEYFAVGPVESHFPFTPVIKMGIGPLYLSALSTYDLFQVYKSIKHDLENLYMLCIQGNVK